MTPEGASIDFLTTIIQTIWSYVKASGKGLYINELQGYLIGASIL